MMTMRQPSEVSKTWASRANASLALGITKGARVNGDEIVINITVNPCGETGSLLRTRRKQNRMWYSRYSMSRFVCGGDDHPEAALKHLADATALHEARRYDGAAYLAGYAVECTLKTVLLHDRTYDPATKQTNASELSSWHKKLSKRPFGHDLANLLAESVGAEGAKYLPPIPSTASVLNWSETIRYRAPHPVDAQQQAYEFLQWAELATESLVRMDLDGVLR